MSFINRPNLKTTPRVRLWGALMLVFGALDLASTLEAMASGFAPSPLALVELALGAAAFAFPSRALLPLFGAIIVWDDVIALLSGETGFTTLIGLALFLLLAADYVQLYRIPESDFSDSEKAAALQASRRLPHLAGLLGALVLLVLALVNLAAAGEWASERWTLVLQNTLVSLALVSVGAGAASLLEQYPGRHRSLVGLVAGLAALGLSLWAAFGS
jgi:hypothetical protein